MCWPSFFIGCGVTAVLALVAWGLVSSYRALKAEDAARGEGDR